MLRLLVSVWRFCLFPAAGKNEDMGVCTHLHYVCVCGCLGFKEMGERWPDQPQRLVISSCTLFQPRKRSNATLRLSWMMPEYNTSYLLKWPSPLRCTCVHTKLETLHKRHELPLAVPLRSRATKGRKGERLNTAPVSLLKTL